jgi:uncharacterized protein YegP (UPF0339 family)
MGTFQYFTDKAGRHRFRLKVKNGPPLLTGEGCITKTGARQAVTSVRIHAPVDAHYERKQTKAGWCFHLRNDKNQVLGTSEMYSSDKARERGIDSVKHYAPGAAEEG